LRRVSIGDPDMPPAGRLKHILAIIAVIALNISIPIVLANNPSDPAQQKYRPLIGGIQIETGTFSWIFWNSRYYCTIGYTARDGNGNTGIVTAGHCTDFSTSFVVYQPNYDFWGSNRIGSPTRINDYSDAAFIPYSSASPSILYIAYQAGVYDGITVPVNSTISWDTIMYYAQTNTSPLFFKTGRTTGTTSGYIIWTAYWDIGPDQRPKYRVIYTNIPTDGGDSGAPLYMYGCGRDGKCWLGLAGHLSYGIITYNINISVFIHISSVAELLGVTPVTASGG